MYYLREIFIEFNDLPSVSGVLVIVITATFSLIAVTGLLTAITASAWNTRKSPNQNLFVRSNIAPYFIMLLSSNFLQSIGGVMSAKWVHTKRVESGPFCTSQGLLKHLSNVSVAVWSLVIAIHTFHVLFFRVSISRRVMNIIVITVSAILLFIVFISFAISRAMTKGPFYGIAGYWCWITDEYDMIRILFDYVVMYISALITFVLYLLVFFRMRGNIIVDGWRIRFLVTDAKNDWNGEEFHTNTGLRIAKKMLLYPIVYMILILPMAIVRSGEWAGQTASYKVIIFCDVVFQSSGFVNVILFTTTRPILPWRAILPWIRAAETQSSSMHPDHISSHCAVPQANEKEDDIESAFHQISTDDPVNNMLMQPLANQPDPLHHLSQPVDPQPSPPPAMPLS